MGQEEVDEDAEVGAAGASAKRAKKNLDCWICYKKGHLSRECPLSRQALLGSVVEGGGENTCVGCFVKYR